MKKPDIHRLIELQELLQQFAHVDRVIHRKHSSQREYIRENDSEHSYNLAMTAWFLAQYFPKLDKDLVIKLALIHDLVEVHAGDTYVFADAATIASKKDREATAYEKLKVEWADFPEMTNHIKDYESLQFEEAKFVYALDKIIPVLTIYINEGYTWQQEKLTLKRLHAEKEKKVAISPALQPYYEQLYNLLIESPHLISPR